MAWRRLDRRFLDLSRNYLHFAGKAQPPGEIMRFRLMITLMLAFLGGCAGNGQQFTVPFAPFGSDIGPDQQAVVMNAASFALSHPIMPVTLQGDHERPEVGYGETIGQIRAGNVRAALIAAGVSPMRIEILGQGGMIYAEGVPMPDIANDVVAIRIGL